MSWSVTAPAEAVAALLIGSLFGQSVRGPSCPPCPSCPDLSCATTVLVWTPALAIGLLCGIVGFLAGRCKSSPEVVHRAPSGLLPAEAELLANNTSTGHHQ